MQLVAVRRVLVFLAFSSFDKEEERLPEVAQVEAQSDKLNGNLEGPPFRHV